MPHLLNNFHRGFWAFQGSGRSDGKQGPQLLRGQNRPGQRVAQDRLWQGHRTDQPGDRQQSRRVTADKRESVTPGSILRHVVDLLTHRLHFGTVMPKIKCSIRNRQAEKFTLTDHGLKGTDMVVIERTPPGNPTNLARALLSKNPSQISRILERTQSETDP